MTTVKADMGSCPKKGAGAWTAGGKADGSVAGVAEVAGMSGGGDMAGRDMTCSLKKERLLYKKTALKGFIDESTYRSAARNSYFHCQAYRRLWLSTHPARYLRGTGV
jgi:hypothetical protein